MCLLQFQFCKSSQTVARHCKDNFQSLLVHMLSIGQMLLFNALQKANQKYLVRWCRTCNYVLCVHLWWSTVQIQSTVGLFCCPPVLCCKSITQWGCILPAWNDLQWNQHPGCCCVSLSILKNSIFCSLWQHHPQKLAGKEGILFHELRTMFWVACWLGYRAFIRRFALCRIGAWASSSFS